MAANQAASPAPSVALVRCGDYELERVYEAVRQAIDLLGGMGAIVGPGQRVLLKPNLVRGMEPERAVTTHPTVVAAVARLVREAGGLPLIAESPGGPYSPGSLRGVYRKTGMAWAAEQSGAELNYDTESVQVSHPEGQVLHRLDLIQPLLEADLVINLPKLKTHNLTTLTLGAKNLFGLVPGSLKISYHAKLVDRALFCEGLLDILAYARPALTLMDAIVGMEGEGPSGGDPRGIGAIVAGTDCLAVDVVCAALVGVAPQDVLTTRLAVGRGLTTGRIEDIEIKGEELASLAVPDFRGGIEAPIDPGLFPGPVRLLARLLSPSPNGEENDSRGAKAMRLLAQGWVWRQLVARPHATERCIACGFCTQHCPVNAIEIVNGRAMMDPKTCIRCYCCHELCPHDAIKLSKPWLGRLLMPR
jgi:uncharacterized protein (DUF362 family)/ferredoxin